MTRLEADLMLWLGGWYTRSFYLYRHDRRMLVGIKP